LMTVYKFLDVIGKWLNVYHYFSSYRRQIEVFSSICFIAVCFIKGLFHSRGKRSTYFLKIVPTPRWPSGWTNQYYIHTLAGPRVGQTSITSTPI